MKIKLFPFLTDEPLSVSVEDEVMTVCRQVVDLSSVPEGYRLPASATACEHFVDFIERINGVLSVTLKLPVTWDAPASLRNPAEPMIIHVSANGPVDVPTPPVSQALAQQPVEGISHD
ncbi:hypothetical protein BFW87_17540 [Pseudomonas fluorescens]|uniref:Uncharacterized protein n=1 Tax=Pseudomonas fluorescens TaxID=294 RepID=A0A1T2YL40_PSEFL|nr:hypothetical protein BFW87_17540 [Pseudomonas fluorescens]